LDLVEVYERKLRARVFLMGLCAVCKRPQREHRLCRERNGDYTLRAAESECGVIPVELLESKSR
jgi:hypothetical protein